MQAQPDYIDLFYRFAAALLIGLLYAVILLAANAARLYLGDTGVYLSSIVSGLVDVDAITLSMAELSSTGGACHCAGSRLEYLGHGRHHTRHGLRHAGQGDPPRHAGDAGHGGRCGVHVVTTVMSWAHRGACHRGPIVRSL